MYAKKDHWLTENHGRLFLTEEEYVTCIGMMKSLSQNPITASLLVGGTPEVSYFWTDPETGLECKARADYRRKGGVLVDIKTTTDVSEAAFPYSVLNYQMHLSAAHYLEAATLCEGETFDRFVLIACEKNAPYPVAAYEIDFGTLEKGLELRNRALLKIKNASAKNNFDDFNEEIKMISIPNYGFGL
jgi:hypothetical protein